MSHYAKRNPENPHGIPSEVHEPKESEAALMEAMRAQATQDAMDEANRQNQRYVEHGKELVEVCREQHDAIDILMATIIRLDPNFMPTRSGLWGTVTRTVAVLAKVEGRA